MPPLQRRENGQRHEMAPLQMQKTKPWILDYSMYEDKARMTEGG